MKRAQKRSRRWAPRAALKKGEAVSCRVPTHVHQAIAREATGHGWTVSAEAAQRLEDSLFTSDTPTAALMRAIGLAIDGMSYGGKTWLTDRYLHQEAQNVVATAFKLVRPQGPSEPSSKLDLDHPRPSGRIGFEMLWSEIRTFVPGRLPPIRTTGPKAGTRPTKSVERQRYERQLALLREGLGKLLDRVVLFGLTGRQARALSEGLSVEGLSVEEVGEFSDLLEKRVVKGLSDKELERLVVLYNRYPGKETLWSGKGPLDIKLKDLSLRGPFGTITKLNDKESTS